MFHPTLSKTGRFFFAPIIRFCEGLGIHHPKALLKIRYRLTFKTKLNLNNPQDLNEKILWAKLYSDTSHWTELADKYKVREYVTNLGLADTLVKLYAVWYKKEDVIFDVLPESFIIKANNGDGKGTNKIVHKADLTEAKKRELIDLVDNWLHRKRVGALSAEPHYKDMTPCVIVEELLPLNPGTSSLTDYKIWCFNGKANFIRTYDDRSIDGSSACVMLYDLNWNMLPNAIKYSSDYPKSHGIPKPKKLSEMIEIAEKLSQGFPELRVDLYYVNDKVYFGELTFTSHGGFNDFTEEYSRKLGNMFNIEDFPKKQ